MKFAIAKEHRDFFQKKGWVEFENFLTSLQVKTLNQAIDHVLALSLKIKEHELRKASPQDCFLKGHDLWRKDKTIQKIAHSPHFAEIGSELIQKKPLRLAYDQLLPYQEENQEIFSKSSCSYNKFLNQVNSLETVSCIRGMACGLIIALKDGENVQKQTDGIDIFPQRSGQAIFFQVSALVNWNYLFHHVGQSFYLITYAYNSAYYQLNIQDPHTHALKHLGYVFNDKLLDKLNPVIFR